MKKHMQGIWAALLSLALLLVVASGCSTTKPKAASVVSPTSKVATTTVYSKALGIDWDYDVYLPAGYNPTAKKRYPVV